MSDAATSGVRRILLTGGEPMLRQTVVMDLLRQCRELGIAPSMSSNGFWGKTADQAHRILGEMHAAGLAHLTISYDRYHAAFMGPEPVVNIARAAEQLRLSLFINITRTAQDKDLTAVVAPFENIGHAQLRFYDVQLLGRARELQGDMLRSEVHGFCNACDNAAVTDDGRVAACNGPSYFAPLHSPLQVGSLQDDTLGELLQRHQSDPILETIRTFGPSYLRDELAALPGFVNFARPDYHGMCDLCLHLTSDADAVAALRGHLAQPRFVAARLAARKTIGTERAGGALSREHVNTVGAARLFFRAALDSASLDESSSRVLGRADLDWNAQMRYLVQCGLSGILASSMDSAALVRWAPKFFRDGMKKHAVHGGVTELAERDAMRRIASTLREVGARGVLLKGGAMLALALEGGPGAVPARFCSDIDIYIAPDKASLVRDRLLQKGFKETVVPAIPVKDKLAKRHQLDALAYNGVGIEIHQTLLPGFCGLPEREMLAEVRPLCNPEMHGLGVLGSEAMFLHSAMHNVKHYFVYGLKTAWDFAWILDHAPNFDWSKLRRWVDKTAMRKGFWVIVHQLNADLDLNIPDEFLSAAPRDRYQKRVESIAGRHVFGKTRPTFHDNPWVCHGFCLLLSHSWLQRARYVVYMGFSGHERQRRRERLATNPDLKRLRWSNAGRAMRQLRKAN